jgi:hypothetical protein
VWGTAEQTYRPLQAYESSVPPSPCCQGDCCPFAANGGRKMLKDRADGEGARPSQNFSRDSTPFHPTAGGADRPRRGDDEPSLLTGGCFCSG